ncbi:MAG TPA: hypothetical protein VIV58_15760, partial [Kofleriaceae bacterium]
MKLLLDTGVLGQVWHPRKYHDVRAWFRRAVLEHELLLSEFADYELRRELLRIGSRLSLASARRAHARASLRASHNGDLARSSA